MVYTTIDGRIIVNGLTSDEGDLIRSGTLYLWDGTRLILPTDHLIPLYTLTSSLHPNALLTNTINYTIKVDCTNDQDPGKELSVSVPIPSGFTLIDWNSNEGTYNDDTELWTPVLSGMEAHLNLTVSCDSNGTQSQTITLNDTGDEITNTCVIASTDSDGALYYTDIEIDDPITLANLQDGEIYTVSAYGYVNDGSLSEIHGGIYNNRLTVINNTIISNPLSNFNAALARLDGGSDEKVQICVLGDSIGEGKFAGDLTSAQMEALGFVGLLRTEYENIYGDVGKGFIPVGYHYGVTGCPWTFSTSPAWTYGGNWDGGVGGGVYYTVNENATATITFNGTGFNLFYAKGPGLGSFQYEVDGGAPSTVDTSNATYDYDAHTDITGLSNDEHTLTITKLNSDSKTVYLFGGYETKTLTNLNAENVARGTDTLGNTAGFTNYGSTITSSTDWADTGTKSLKVATNNSAAGEGAYYIFDSTPGDDYAVQIKIKGTIGNTYRMYVLGHTGGTTTMLLETFTLTETEETIEYTGVCPAGITQLAVRVLTHTKRSENFYLDSLISVHGTSVPDTAGVVVNCCSRSGSTTYSHQKTGVMELEIDHFAPTLTVLEFGANDYGTQIPLDDFESRVETLILRAKAHGDVVILPLGLQEDEYSIPFSDYVDVLSDLAHANNCLFVDIFGVWGYDYDYVKDELSYIYDNVHPNTAGHNSISNILSKTIEDNATVVNGLAVHGERVTTESTYQQLNTIFTYDERCELVIRLNGQYQTVSTACEDRWAGIGLYQGYQTSYSEPANLLSNPTALLSDSGSSDITLDSNTESTTYSYNLPVSALTNPLSLFSGIELKLNSFAASNSGIEVSLESSNGNISSAKSSYISRTGTITFGGMTDLWDLDSTDIEGETLTLHITFTNTTREQATFTYNNILFTLYYVEDQTGGADGFTANNIHSVNYQLLLLDVDLPEGPEREVGTVNFPLSDGETVVNHSFKSKDIKIKFVVWGETLDEAKVKLRNISQWLTNDRNTLSIPVPYELVFDFEDDMTYHVILNDPIDTEINYTAIECEATFNVPSGVALTSETKITGPVGTNNGITKIKPVVTVLCDGSTGITITDTISEQSIMIDEEITDGTLITIDCDARTILDEADNDYTTSVNIESIWFNFFTSYDLSCTGGQVQSVSFKEGY